MFRENILDNEWNIINLENTEIYNTKNKVKEEILEIILKF